MIEHANTDHPHAYVMAFGKQRVAKDELEAMRERLGEREQERTRAQEQEQARKQELDRGWDYER